jgi:hypothetical protein
LTDSIQSDDLSNEQPGQSSAKDTKKIKGYDLTKNDFLFDTLLLERIRIKRLLITDSKGSYENDTKFTIPNLWLLAENINYDPVSAKDASRIFFSDNLVAKIANFSYVTPDNLSSISMDEMEINSKDSSITVNNFILTPLVSRYDYGPARGFQSTWMQMKNESIILDKVDFLKIINKGALYAKSLKIYKPEISVFRDKRIPFPEWQRKPLPQTTLRELGFTVNIDTINLINGYINYQEHPEKAYSTGEVFFTDLNATILNLTNDSIRTLTYSKTNIEASANVFDKGKVKAAFLFDLKNMDNIHTYGIELDSMDLSEFNRILIPSASVQIASGHNNKIIMNARANETYSYGEMKFYYDELKIQLLNRETETPKGLGNALGSFFANTFIIKTNNPRNFFLRKGDIFFERDEKRAIFNYWTKTFLSGVVSSIGATNNKKKYNKMQAEDQKKTTQEISE